MPSLKEIQEFMAREFPQSTVLVDRVGKGEATVRQLIGEAELRPGGTVSGPVLMTVADVALYVAILSTIGLEALTVTTNLSFNFLRKPSADRAIVGVCTLLKVGKRLVVGQVSLYSEGIEEPVAHAVGTYSIPPKR